MCVCVLMMMGGTSRERERVARRVLGRGGKGGVCSVWLFGTGVLGEDYRGSFIIVLYLFLFFDQF